MRFCDLFISYKIGLKSIKRDRQFNKFPIHIKVFIFIFIPIFVSSIILLIFIQNIFSFIPIGTCLILLSIFAIIDSKKDNLNYMLENHYIPYSKKRINMTIDVLKKYNINIENLDSLDMLITEAKHAQASCDFLSQFKEPFKILSSIIIPIVMFVARKITEATTPNQIFFIAAVAIYFILLIFLIIFFLIYIINYLFYKDYNIYNELMYDLRQIKLFYAKNPTNNLPFN